MMSVLVPISIIEQVRHLNMFAFGITLDLSLLNMLCVPLLLVQVFLHYYQKC